MTATVVVSCGHGENVAINNDVIIFSHVRLITTHLQVWTHTTGVNDCNARNKAEQRTKERPPSERIAQERFPY